MGATDLNGRFMIMTTRAERFRSSHRAALRARVVWSVYDIYLVGAGLWTWAVLALAVATWGALATPSVAGHGAPRLVGAGAGSQQATSDDAPVALQPGARNMKVAILSPQDSATIDAPIVVVEVAMIGFTPRCDRAATGTAEGEGHYDLYLDHILVDVYCTPQVSLSLVNVRPGAHVLTADPAQNDNLEVRENAVSVSFRYEPMSPLPEVRPAGFGSVPTIRILAPAPDQTVSGGFDVVVSVTGINLDCDLYGKPDVHGYGNWQLDLDGIPQSNGGPVPGNMMGMACTRTFHASTAGLAAGSIHALTATLTGDDHRPLVPMVTDQVRVRVG